MSELSHLVKAVKENLSKEDRVLLRAVYRPPQPDAYDGMFDRVVDRLRDQAHASRNPLRPS